MNTISLPIPLTEGYLEFTVLGEFEGGGVPPPEGRGRET